MKHTGKAILLALLASLIFVLPAWAAPTVTVDGRTLEFDVPPRVEQGTTLVPLRGIFEALGASVAWDGTTQTVTASKGGTQIQLTIGSNTAYKNGTPVTLSVPGKVVGGSTVVPLRFVSEALGASVAWDASTQMITITSPSTSPLAVSSVPYEVKEGQFSSKLPTGWTIIEEKKDGSSNPIYLLAAETAAKTAQVIITASTVGYGYSIDDALRAYRPLSYMKNWQELSRTKVQTGCGPGWLVHGQGDVGGSSAKAFVLLALDADRLFMAFAWCRSSDWAGYEVGFREILASITPLRQTSQITAPPTDLARALKNEFGSVAGLSSFSFSVLDAENTLLIAMQLDDYDADRKWHQIPRETREKYLRAMLNRVHQWFPAKGIFIKVKLTFDYHTWSPSVDDNIISFDINRGWRVMNTYYSGHASYLWDGSIIIDPEK